MASSMDLRGAADLDKAMKLLGEKPAERIMKSGIRAAAVVIKKGAQQLVRVESQNLKKGIVVKARRTKYNIVSVSVGILQPVSKRAHLEEFGAAPHTIKIPKTTPTGGSYIQTIQHPGSPANSFMRASLDQNSKAALDAMLSKGRKAFSREIKKLSK